MPIFQIQNKKLKQIQEKKFDLEKDLQLLTEENLEEIFGLQFISGKKNKQMGFRNSELDTLAFDKESRAFVIIEYKKDQSFSIIDQGFNYLALMLNNKAEFILEYNERLNANLKKADVDWSQSRVMFIAPSFTPHQKGALSFRDLPIELWEVNLYEGNMVFYNQIKSAETTESVKKITRSKTVDEVSKEVKTYTVEDHLSKANSAIRELFKKMRREIFELDNRVQEKPVSWYIGYKIRYHNFCSISIYSNKLRIYVRRDKIDDSKGIFKVIPPSYKWGVTKLWTTDIDKENQIDYVMSVIRQGYESAPDK